MESILVIDDDELVGRTIHRALSRHGYDVDLAINGAEAIEKCEARNYDIVLSDIRMPVMNGIEVMSRIKQDCKKRFMTGYVDKKYEYLDFLRKPFGIDELLAYIK